MTKGFFMSGDIRETLFGPPDDFSDWDEDQIAALWRSHNELRAALDTCRRICYNDRIIRDENEDAQGGSFELSASVRRRRSRPGRPGTHHELCGS